MARLIGTGKDPRYPEGHVVDSPGGSAEYHSLIDKGWVKALPPESDPSRSDRQIAESVVRGDTLSDPVDAALAEKYQNGDADPYEQVHDGPQPDSAGHGRPAVIGGRVIPSPDQAVELSQSKLGSAGSLLERAGGAREGQPVGSADEGNGGSDGLDDKSRGDLDKIAADEGVNEPERLPNRPAVIAAIREQRASVSA